MSEEQQYWQRLINELQGWKVTLEMIAEELGVSDRQVSNWKAGQRPTGITAVKLYLFHMKHRRVIQGSPLHSESEE
jgi:DNA-binding transcriptional regulator YiaG